MTSDFVARLPWHIPGGSIRGDRLGDEGLREINDRPIRIIWIS
jgi:hypothetical protein